MLRTRCASLCFVLMLCLCTLPLAAHPGVVQTTWAAGTTISATPDTLSASVLLGQQKMLDLTLKNATSPAANVRLYEALQSPAPGTSQLAAPPPPSLRRVALPEQATRVDPQIREHQAGASDGKSEFIVFLNEQADLSAAYRIADWSDRGWAVYQTLHDAAERSQAGIRTLLDARGTAYRPFWIVNALLVRGTTLDLQALDSRSDVAMLTANTITALPPDTADSASAASVGIASCSPDITDNNSSTCWNVRKMGADRVWRDFGVSGQGVTVANIDTGVRYTHAALMQQYRGYRGPNTLDHSYNWFDPQGTYAVPTDNNGHGSHTMGSMVGRGDGTVNQPAVGIAPGAEWIAAQGCDNRDCSESDLIAAAQWLLTPTDPNGDNPRPDLRPQVINNSWAGTSNDSWYTGYVAAWRAAGIFPVFAAGNSGPNCGSIQSPADYANAMGVGSTTLNDTISSFSAAGPTKDGRLKPDISAPGSQILSSTNAGDTSYGVLSGTSMAAPQVAGAVALLLSADPTLVGDYDRTYALLTGSAQRLEDQHCGGNSVQNNVFGYGRVDAYAAVSQTRIDVPWLALNTSQASIAANGETHIQITLDATRVAKPDTYRARVLAQAGDVSQAPLTIDVTFTVLPIRNQGTVEGKVRDATSGAALRANVRVENGPVIPVDNSGNYNVTLPMRATPYTLIASATGYLSATATVLLSDTVESTQSFSLTANLQRLAVSTDVLTAALDFNQQVDRPTTISNVGTQPLSYTATIPINDFGVWPSSDPLGPTYRWISAPNAQRLALADDETTATPLPLGFKFPFYGQEYDSVYIQANGVLFFDPPVNTSGFVGGCLPTTDTLGGAIAPFRVDLDPSQGGNISYASTPDGFVVTFDHVPLHSATPGSATPTYSFQTVLKPDGRILFQYGELGALPSTLAVGVQRAPYEAQSIGCGRTTPVQSDSALELWPQPSSELWAGLVGTEAIVPPGGQVQLTVRLRWIRPNMTTSQPLRSEVIITSDDPRQPQVRIPFTLSTISASYEVRMPLIFH